MHRADPEPVICAHPNCLKWASIIHANSPLCGKHALAEWEREEQRRLLRQAPRKRLSIRV